jgi:hypothetical protein
MDIFADAYWFLDDLKNPVGTSMIAGSMTTLPTTVGNKIALVSVTEYLRPAVTALYVRRRVS